MPPRSAMQSRPVASSANEELRCSGRHSRLSWVETSEKRVHDICVNSRPAREIINQTSLFQYVEWDVLLDTATAEGPRGAPIDMRHASFTQLWSNESFMANLLWLQGGACSGNTMSFLNAEEPSVCDLVTDFGIKILWHT